MGGHARFILVLGGAYIEVYSTAVPPRQHASAASRAASTRGGAMFTTGANVAHVDLECVCCTSCSTRCVEQLVQDAHSRCAIFVSTEANSRWQPFCGDLAIPARSSVRSSQACLPDASLRRARVGGACVMRLAGLHMLDHIIIINKKSNAPSKKRGTTYMSPWAAHGPSTASPRRPRG